MVSLPSCTYVKEPSEFRVNNPIDTSVIKVAVILSPSTSISLSVITFPVNVPPSSRS